jgi:hypothetical protein
MEPVYPLKVSVVVFDPGDTLPPPEIVPATEEIVVIAPETVLTSVPNEVVTMQ